jgi:hypothetical protein
MASRVDSVARASAVGTPVTSEWGSGKHFKAARPYHSFTTVAFPLSSPTRSTPGCLLVCLGGGPEMK